MAATVSSITKQGTFEPFSLQVARGQVGGHSAVFIYGYQAVIGTVSLPVWDVATAYVYPVSAQNMTLYSSSASDVTQQVQIQGLDLNFNPLSETLTLTNGVTGVVTANQYLRINYLVQVGGAAAVGNLSLANAGKTVIYAQINIGYGQNQTSIYTVPNGFDFYLYRAVFSSNEQGGGTNTSNLAIMLYDNVQNVKRTFIRTPFSLFRESTCSFPHKIKSKTDLQVQVAVASGTSPIGITIEGVLIQSDVLTNIPA